MTDLNDYTITSGGGSAATIVRYNDQGNLEETEYDRLPYDDVPKGSYDLEITGFQKRFELPRPAGFPKEDWQSDMVSKTRLEFTVLNGPHTGKRFYCMYTWSVGERANLGKLLRAVTGKPIPSQWSMPSVLGATFHALVIHAKGQDGQVKLGRDGNPFPDVVVDSIEPFDMEPVPDVLKPTPKKPTAVTTYDAFWKWANGYGFTKLGDIAKATKMSMEALDELTAQDMYELMKEVVQEKASA